MLQVWCTHATLTSAALQNTEGESILKKEEERISINTITYFHPMPKSSLANPILHAYEALIPLKEDPWGNIKKQQQQEGTKK